MDSIAKDPHALVSKGLMESGSRCFWGLSLSLSALFLAHSMSSTTTSSRDVYIVYLGHTYNRDPLIVSDYHLDLLSNVFDSKVEAKEAMLYSYKHVFSGFAASLDADQAAILASSHDMISMFKSTTINLHTTRSWDFMGLTIDYHTQGTPLQLAYGSDVIVGVFDSGVWPELPSFKEEPDMAPVPKRWKGRCISGDQFDSKKHCNRKLIGAKYFLKGFEKEYGKINKTEQKEYRSVRDRLGHGTHTASTAVGSRVRDANINGFAKGTARGGAPRARLAVYKVCWKKDSDGTCMEVDILAAFDEALHDGVDVISASFGKEPPLKPFFASSSDIGSFHAMQLGVSVVFSAGNAGPDPALVGNVNPWSICVAASSTDRTFPTRIVLDESTTFMGEGFVTDHITGTLANASRYFTDGVCLRENWNKQSAKGMIILCFSTYGGVDNLNAEFAAYKASAAAIIFVQPLTEPVAALSILPSVHIDIIQGTKLRLMPNCTKVHILPSETVFGSSPAPVVAEYSSRGPSSISSNILKPDITAPGVNILAAWPPNVPPTDFGKYDNRSVKWNFNSGTSMSCPHVSGVVALLKSAHPHWSPAAIRSALMTTAYNTDIYDNTISLRASTKSSDPFDIGAGHMNPVKAFDPGLIYDMTARDYVLYLCSIGYSEEQIRALVNCLPVKCPNEASSPLHPDSWNLNYPSITIPNLQRRTTIKRSVRNVGYTKAAIYFVRMVEPSGVEVVVWPRVLIFSPWKEEETYYVTLKPSRMSEGRYSFGSITWTDGFHEVRSPLVVQVNSNIAGISPV